MITIDQVRAAQQIAPLAPETAQLQREYQMQINAADRSRRATNDHTKCTLCGWNRNVHQHDTLRCPGEGAFAETVFSAGSSAALTTPLAKHTPGPWRKAHSDSGVVYVVACDGSGDIACVSPKLDGMDNAARILEQHANANLIASTPDLLSALAGLVAVGDGTAPDTGHAWEAAREALEKAKGVA